MRPALAALLLLAALAGPARAGTTEVVAERNEHGGRSVRTVFAAADKELDQGGLASDLFVYDADGNVVRREIALIPDRTDVTYETAIILDFAPAAGDGQGADHGGRPVSREVRYAPDAPASFGIARKVDYFNDKGVSVRTEVYSSPQAAASDGCVRGVFKRDGAGRLTSIEYLFTEAMADEIGISIRIDIYDHRQVAVRTEYYDKSGNLIAAQDN